jgi:hypothetical protein
MTVARHVSAGSEARENQLSPGGTASRHVVPDGTPQAAVFLFPALTCWAIAISSLSGLLKQLLGIAAD